MSSKKRILSMLLALSLLAAILCVPVSANPIVPSKSSSDNLSEHNPLLKWTFSDNAAANLTIFPQSMIDSDIPIDVTITAAPGYEIYYTIDGTSPTDQSVKYEEFFHHSLR